MQLQTQSQQNNLIDVVDAMPKYFYNPLGFVYSVYAWGEGVLKGERGPDEWQRKVLLEIGQKCKENLEEALYVAIKSGHEVGKTALVAWVIHWFISTRPFPQIVVTANTLSQLHTKTWRELAKWHNLSIHKKWYEWTATKFYHKAYPETWFAAAIPWSAEKSEAFAGTHEKYVLFVFDESSAIDDVIWEVAEGAMGAGAIWVAAGNPTKNTGRFKECFNRYRHRWVQFTVDARETVRANMARIRQWVEDYGEDSDFCRIRVKGEFPRSSSAQFIPVDLVEAARVRKLEIPSFQYAPVLIGVDIARFGDDQSVILVRQGGHIEEIKKYREKDTMQMVGYIAETITKYQMPTTFIDEVGIGAGVIDRLRQLGFQVIPVNNGRSATDEHLYANLRAETWAKMKAWLETGSIPDDKELIADLIGPEYGIDRLNRFQLEKKNDMKSRGLASPDVGDALAITFALSTYSNADIILKQALMEQQHRQQGPSFIVLDPEAGY